MNKTYLRVHKRERALLIRSHAAFSHYTLVPSLRIPKHMNVSASHSQATQTPPPRWTEEKIRALVQEKCNRRACRWQIKAGETVYGGKDGIIIAATGLGKTLSFLPGLLMKIADGHANNMVIIVSPLNLLGQQSAESEILKKAGLTAVSVNAKTASKEIFSVCEDHPTELYLI